MRQLGKESEDGQLKHKADKQDLLTCCRETHVKHRHTGQSNCRENKSVHISLDKIRTRERSIIDTGDSFGLQRGQGLGRHSDSVVASNSIRQTVKMAAMRDQRGPGSLLEALTPPLKNWEK